MQTLIERVAMAKAMCRDFAARLELVGNTSSGAYLFRVFLRGPAGVSLRWFMETSDPSGASIDELEEHLQELERAVAQAVEQHACHDCDAGGVCDFFIENRLPLLRDNAIFPPRALRAERRQIQAEYELARKAASVADILKEA